jgi:hypothetical protein
VMAKCTSGTSRLNSTMTTLTMRISSQAAAMAVQHETPQSIGIQGLRMSDEIE